MLRIIARAWAMLAYRFRQEVEAETNELHSRLASNLAAEKRKSAEQFKKEAQEMDARIKEVEEQENKGYYLCENGHEKDSALQPSEGEDAPTFCSVCTQPAKFIKRDQMTGQEKYESDKERGEAQDIAKQKLAQAEQEDKDASDSDKVAKYYHGLAQSNRNVAERLRKI